MFFNGFVPGIWKEATILPLKNAGKPPGAISSYRPVSRTSCVVKTMERMVLNRLYYLSETRGWICNEQAGFHKLRSCDVQILRITQFISDGFQATKTQGSLKAHIDFSKSFDRVWREELLLATSSMGLLIPFTRWLRDVLSNRIARVQINGKRGDSFTTKARASTRCGAVSAAVPSMHIRPALRCAGDGEGGTLHRKRLPHQQLPQQTSHREGATACGHRRRRMEHLQENCP